MARRNKTKETKLLIFIYSLIALSVILIAAARFGYVGQVMDNFAVILFGSGLNKGLYAIFGIFFLFTVIFRRWPKYPLRIWISIILFCLSLLLFNAILRSADPSSIGDWLNKLSKIIAQTEPDEGGFFSILLYSLFNVMVARTGTIIITIVLFIIASALLIDYHQLWPNLKFKTRKPRQFEEEEERPLFIEPDEPLPKRRLIKDTPIAEISTTSAATIHSIGNYTLPSVNLLEEVVLKNKSIANQNAAVVKGKRLIEILSQFDINATLIGTHIGPAVTKFEVKPDSNIKISKISSIQDNIKMELQAKELRIEAPIPGRNAVGVEIPNVEMIPVRMSEMMKDPTIGDRSTKKLLVPLGKDLMGKIVYTELDKMPHLLIAGATGSGKSVCINAFITTILLRTSPDEVKLLLIDPKKVEFVAYQKIPHLICPVISDSSEAAKVLRVIVNMMENRYEVFSKVGVRNITTYNELLIKQPQEHLEFMPWIIVIIDELADLMIVAGKEVESSIQRITQLARAAGIHLIVATQRPSTDVITGIIKANIPSRIAFAVSSGIDSRTILDHVGAERLLGYGDMLFFPVGEPSSIRIQGVYVSDEEVKRLADATSIQRAPNFDEAFLHLNDPEEEQTEDPLYEEVKLFVLETRRASTSTIQRHFGLGYNRAARIMDMLEQKGIIGPQQGSKPRDVYGKNNEGGF
ncbi:MAG: DNA segregation ATPase FtsK/SpoIIIE S-DNA-T family [Erysipelotrichaceae bacterium]|nr:MAG: DNA segregation ATPase FtsK/SpoIIIE S-DNA-T family [Erysipelotrichaceae bacterium]